MRFGLIFCVAFGSLGHLFAVDCRAEKSTGSEQVKLLSNTASTATGTTAAATTARTKLTPAKATTVAKLGEPKPRFAPLGSPDKPVSAPQGKPKFALKNNTPVAAASSGDALGRAAEVKRLIDSYHSLAIRYVEDLAKVTTPEQAEEVAKRKPSVKSLKPFVVLLAHQVAADPKDEAALDALVFFCKFVGVPEVDEALAGKPDDDSTAPVDPMALLLEHHADNPKIVNAMRRLPRGDATDTFLNVLFEKTCNPNVRWSSGAQLISSLRRYQRLQQMEEIVITMSEDRYLEGVPVGRTSNARTWAANKLQEIRTLGVGNVLPEVSGEKLDGGIGSITDYRGKVVVLDVWTTWCGPCRRMIPHHVELTERLKDKPFAILSVSCDRDRKTLEDFLVGTAMPWDHWWVAPDSEFKQKLNISSFPTIYVLDAAGVIRHKNIKDQQLEEAVDSLLSEIEDSATDPQK